MNSFKIVPISGKMELEKVFPLIFELRPHLDLNNFINIYEQAHKQDSYKIYVVEQSENYIAAMGCRILYDFVHGKHLYIDDLVVTDMARSKGIGAILLEFAEKLAKEENCNKLRLCTGNENIRGKKFYIKNKWEQRAVVFKKTLS